MTWTVATSRPGRAPVTRYTGDEQGARICYTVLRTTARKGVMTELLDPSGETVDADVSARARGFKVPIRRAHGTRAQLALAL